MLSSDAVAVTWGYRVLGNAGWLMSLVVCLSTLGAISGGFLAGGRLPYVAARKGHLLQVKILSFQIIFSSFVCSVVHNSTEFFFIFVSISQNFSCFAFEEMYEAY